MSSSQLPTTTTVTDTSQQSLRVNLFRNGSSLNGIAVNVPVTYDELLHLVSTKLNIHAKKIFNNRGGAIDDITLLRCDDALYVSEGESFVGLTSRSEDRVELPCQHNTSEWVTLNVGGKYFTTTRATLTSKPDTMLSKMFAVESPGETWNNSVDNRGAYLIDRSPRYFEPILNYLRHGQLIFEKDLNLKGVLEEANFFGIAPLVEQLEKLVMESKNDNENSPLTRRDVVNALITTPSLCELRFQGVNLSGCNLSHLDLRHVNLKSADLSHAILVGTNLSYCNLEWANLSHATLERVNLLGAKMIQINLENAVLTNCNFEDPAGTKANLEGAKMKNITCESCLMAWVNLRVANMKNSKVRNCNLRGAILAGADLENCQIYGCDLQEANLRGANVIGTQFEEMVSPLHMAQSLNCRHAQLIN